MTKTADLVQHLPAPETLPGGGLSWLRTLRREAAEQFGFMGLPGRRNEDWKYTNLEPLGETGFLERIQEPVSAGRRPAPPPESAMPPGLRDAYRVVFADGLFVSGPPPEELPAGVRLGSLRDALEEPPDLLRDHLGACANTHRHPMVALNMACFLDGLFLHLPEGVRLDRPVHVVLLGEQGSLGRAVHTRNLILAGPGSSALVLESHGRPEEGGRLSNVVTEASLGPKSRLEHVRVQRNGPETWHTGMLAVHQAACSRLVSRSLACGAAVARDEIAVLLDAEEARCDLEGLYLGSGRRHLDHHTHVDHAVPRTTSREAYRGILDGRSNGVFTARVLVRQDARHADADQSNRALLLSPEATINARPQLEIYTDEVKCSHGATSGRLDEQALFYLRSRGLTESRARAVLTGAFAREVLRGVENEPLRRHLEGILAHELGPESVETGLS